MADDPGRPPIDAPVLGSDGKLTPVWARWFVAFYLYVKGL